MKKTKEKEMKEEKGEKKEREQGKECRDINCPFHGSLRARGRIFRGKIKKIVVKRAVVEFERLIYSKKYERYAKGKTRLHAHIPDCMANNVKVNDVVEVCECRPLSKITHFVILKKI